MLCYSFLIVTNGNASGIDAANVFVVFQVDRVTQKHLMTCHLVLDSTMIFTLSTGREIWPGIVCGIGTLSKRNGNRFVTLYVAHTMHGLDGFASSWSA